MKSARRAIAVLLRRIAAAIDAPAPHPFHHLVDK